MPALIADMPWPPDLGEDLRRPDGTLVTDPTSNRPLRVYHDQIVVWASLAPAASLPAGLPLFPALIDTGYNDGFLMQQRQAEAWMTPAVFAQFSRNGLYLPLGRTGLPCWDADLWVYPNVPGTRDPDPAGAPIRLNLPLGVTLIPPGSAYTKEKPLIGLRAIRFNGLTLRLDGRHRRVWIDTP
jgi:hypothetical protein